MRCAAPATAPYRARWRLAKTQGMRLSRPWRRARDAAPELGLTSDDAAATIAEGSLEAAADSGEDVLLAVRQAIHRLLL